MLNESFRVFYRKLLYKDTRLLFLNYYDVNDLKNYDFETNSRLIYFSFIRIV